MCHRCATTSRWAAAADLAASSAMAVPQPVVASAARRPMGALRQHMVAPLRTALLRHTGALPTAGLCPESGCITRVHHCPSQRACLLSSRLPLSRPSILCTGPHTAVTTTRPLTPPGGAARRGLAAPTGMRPAVVAAAGSAGRVVAKCDNPAHRSQLSAILAGQPAARYCGSGRS